MAAILTKPIQLTSSFAKQSATTARYYVPGARPNYQAAIELGLDPTLSSSPATAQATIQNIVAWGNKDYFTADTANLLNKI